MTPSQSAQSRRSVTVFCLLLFAFCVLPSTFGQSASATLSGTVADQNGAVVPGATITAENKATGLKRQATTNGEGYFTIPLLPPSAYSVTAQAQGFSPVQVSNVVLNVGDQKALQIQLKAGDINATVQVINEAPLVNTESGTVSTVVNRQFVENMPMNGRSFQTLIDLTPGVVIAAANGSGFESGQFNVNGQRASSNYWTVDGVGANIGTSTQFQGTAVGGALGSFSALGGTNSLVSVDALQEFRIQTSTYAPEFGRTPGGQISIVTRSGTNRFHGTLFDYLRNDVLDANNWFNNSVGLPKSKERQNDFGGTFEGPLVKNRTFFFFSFEGLRLRLPQTGLTSVPDVNARNSAVPAMQPYLKAYPLPNGTDNPATGVAQFNATFSNPASLDAYSIRIDHKFNDHLTLFGRYNYSPSGIDQRGSGGDALSEVAVRRIRTQTATAGATWVVSPRLTNDLRLNYSRVNGSGSFFLDTFGGAVPLASLGLPSQFTTSNARIAFDLFAFSGGNYLDGALISNIQQQWNVVDSVSLQRGSHALKSGVDYRRLTPLFAPFQYGQIPIFFTLASAQAGTPLFTQEQVNANAKFLLRNLGAFAQDTWRVNQALSLTYGLRWDVDFSPATLSGPSFPAVTGFNFNDLSQLTVAPDGTPAFKTPYGNIAPRVGLAYQLSQNPKWNTVIRGGFGVFFDLATQQVGTLIGQGAFPFSGSRITPGGFPLSSAISPPPIVPPGSGQGRVIAFDPNLKLPYTLEWNVSVEQALGRQQTISGSYVGSAGRRLIQSAVILRPNSNYAQADLVGNTATSKYRALQVQLQRRLSRGLQALASYTFAHSVDDASTGSLAGSDKLVPGIGASANRGPSDFDIRHTFSTALTYYVPAPKSNAFAKTIMRGWSLNSIVQVSSAPPINIFYGTFSTLLGSSTLVRPDLVPGIPLYLFGPQFPGGKAFNNTPNQGGPGCTGPFCPPPLAGGVPTRQGNFGRNSLRGFGLTQWDFAIHRDFAIREAVKLEFRAEMFNVLNHPNFGQPVANLNDLSFGKSTQTFGQFLSGGTLGTGGFNPLYQVGGPRSIQFALKVMF